MLPHELALAFRRAPGMVLTTRQIVRLGFGRRHVIALSDEGLIHRLLYGVYRDPSAQVPETQHLHATIAYLGQRRPDHCRPEAITGGAGLALRRVPGFDIGASPLVLVDMPRHLRRAREGFQSRRTDLSRVPVEVVRGVPVTSPAWSVADSALNLCVTDGHIRNAVDDLRNRQLLDIVQAAHQWGSMPHVGARRLQRMAADGVFEQESDGERDAFRRLFNEFDPRPDCQVYLAPNIRVDFVFLSAGLVIEYHGGVHDGSVDRDSTRAFAIRRLHYEVIAVTKSMMRDPAGTAAAIDGIRAEREQLIWSGHLPRPRVMVQPERLTPLRTRHATLTSV